MDTKEIFSDYINRVAEDPEEYYQDFLKTKEAVANSSAQYKGEPVPFLYQPMFITQKDRQIFRKLSSTLLSILNKVIERYAADPSYRKKFGFSELLEELILLDHGYDVNVPMARFDIFYGDDGNFKFCELNADGSSGMNETNVIERIFLESKAVQAMKAKYEVGYFELLETWVDESIKIFHQFNKEIEKPNVAIVDWKGLATALEFEEFKKAYIRKGYQAQVVDPRELRYENGKLYAGDMKIDLIYRRLVTFELIERSDEIPDFLQAYRDGAVCVIGPVRSQIIHNKIIFKVLHDEDTMELLTEDERLFVRDHVPLTMEFKGDRSIFDDCIANKDRYVLKPMDLYASKGVYVGRDCTDEEWKEKAEEFWENHYLLQEFCLPYAIDMVNFKEGELSIEKFKHIIGLYMYNEKFAGAYTRVSKSNIIASAHGCYNLPNLTVKEK